MSLSQGPTEPPLLPHTIPEHFASIVSRFGDREAVIFRRPTTPGSGSGSGSGSDQTGEQGTLTYSTLDLLSDQLAHALRSRAGVHKGDRVAVSLGNCAEFAVLTYALAKLGAVAAPLNPGFTAAQVAAALRHLGVRTLVIAAVTDLPYRPGRGRDNLPLLRALVPDLERSPGGGGVEAPDVPTLEHVLVVDNTPWHAGVAPWRPDKFPCLTPFSSLLPRVDDGASSAAASSSSSSSSVVPDASLSPDETINIQFTSGTTSQPKAAMLTHASILNNGYLIGDRMGLEPADRIVCPPPLFHCFGSVLGYMATATTGAAILFPSPAFDPLATLRMAADLRATGLYGVATMFVAMLDLLGDEQLPREAARALPTHLRKGIAAGSSVPEPLMRRLYAALGLQDLVICYGMTETSPVSCMTSPRDPPARRAASVGRAMPHTRVKVVDPADRRGAAAVLPVGRRGELAASGYLVMRGYWGDEARTREVRVWEEGAWWMYSGDEASMDAEGYVTITGRIKDVIIRGGENIHPLEVEECLFQHPLVAEASVVGVPDERHGEAVGAFVVVQRGAVAVDDDDDEEARHDNNENTITKQDVRDWVRQRLSAHMVPKHVFWVDEYPKTASGKIQKFKLREAAAEMLRGKG